MESLCLWPSISPGDLELQIPPESSKAPLPGQNSVLRLENVSRPMISVFPAKTEAARIPAVLVCPGGAYNVLAYEHEGTEVCRWLNEIGVTGILLKYRVPRRPGRPKHEAPLQDAQRALGLIRRNAEKWKIDSGKVGILGFSAGGNLAMMALTHFDERTYPKIDEADEFSCRPDFGVLIYPAYLVDRAKPEKLFPEVRITARTPPCFFAHTGDDQVPAEGSVLAYLALEKAGVLGNELHVFPYGGHGYGIRMSKNPVSHWPARVADWMVANKWISPPSKILLQQP